MGDSLVCGGGCLSEMSPSRMHCIGVLISLLGFGDTGSRQQWRSVSYWGVTSSEGQALGADKDEPCCGKKVVLERGRKKRTAKTPCSLETPLMSLLTPLSACSAAGEHEQQSSKEERVDVCPAVGEATPDAGLRLAGGCPEWGWPAGQCLARLLQTPGQSQAHIQACRQLSLQTWS